MSILIVSARELPDRHKLKIRNDLPAGYYPEVIWYYIYDEEVPGMPNGEEVVKAHYQVQKYIKRTNPSMIITIGRAAYRLAANKVDEMFEAKAWEADGRWYLSLHDMDFASAHDSAKHHNQYLLGQV